MAIAGKFDYTRAQQSADGMIRKFGADAVLRRSTGDRPCVAAVMQFSPQERLGRVMNPTDRKALVSALAPDGTPLSTPPQFPTDVLVTFVQPATDPPVEDEVLRIVEPPGKISPADVPIFWRLTVRR